MLPTHLPKIKSNVILSYFLLVSIFVGIGMIVFSFYPELFEKLTNQNFDDKIKTTLVLLIPLIFFVQFISWFLNATFELKWSSFIEKLNIFIIFILLLLSWLFVVDNFLENIIYFFILSIIASYRKIKNTITKTKVKLFYFPKGFWNFALTAQFMTFF